MANNPSGRITLISEPFWELDVVGYIVPYMEPPISPCTNMKAAFGRFHNSGVGAFGARPTVVESMMVDGEIGGSIVGYIIIYPTIAGSQNGAEIDIILPEGLFITAEELLHNPVYPVSAVFVGIPWHLELQIILQRRLYRAATQTSFTA